MKKPSPSLARPLDPEQILFFNWLAAWAGERRFTPLHVLPSVRENMRKHMHPRLRRIVRVGRLARLAWQFGKMDDYHYCVGQLRDRIEDLVSWSAIFESGMHRLREEVAVQMVDNLTREREARIAQAREASKKPRKKRKKKPFKHVGIRQQQRRKQPLAKAKKP